VTDLGFISRVAAMLLAEPGPAHTVWSGRGLLRESARAGLGADPAAGTWLAEAMARPRPDLVPLLSGALHRAAVADRVFAATMRQLVLDAYAEPGLCCELPAPWPPE
jgi:hypothetical protein